MLPNNAIRPRTLRHRAGLRFPSIRKTTNDDIRAGADNDPGLSRRRREELADWYEGQQRSRNGNLDTAELDNVLREILREEAPQQVEDESMGASPSHLLDRQVIENRPGAGGTVGTEVVMRAAPDGYTLLMEVVPSSAINAALYPNLKYNFVRDSAPISSIGVAAYIMVVNPAVPATTVQEFIA